MLLILISAMTRDRVIGKDQVLPSSILEEYALDAEWTSAGPTG